MIFPRLLKRFFGSRNDRLLSSFDKTIERINGFEGAVKDLSDEAFKGKTAEFRQRLTNGEQLDALLPEAFAVVREASHRALGMRHFDVQLIGGLVLHMGKIAEMRTGEGKTLMATLPAYTNALTGNSVHIVTVNDYLARRDAAWMGKIYEFLGMSVGVIVPNQPREEKQASYRCDIVYGTNNEFGFDYLRDNMKYSMEDRAQRPLNYAIVDEVDSILIDEARTPLIISGPAEQQTDLYIKVDKAVPFLTRCEKEGAPGDFWVDEKARNVHLTEAGHDNIEKVLARLNLLPAGASLYDTGHIALLHHLNCALRAHSLFIRDQHYVVHEGEVVIVDEFTGRLMSGRRWSDGLHQAVEAKEGVSIQSENQTLASITFQNYFRLYKKLSGMTGTADTEAYEFYQIYNLETVVIPTHMPMVRKDDNDRIYRTAEEKYTAILDDIRTAHEAGQPVLVGTSSIENSELFSRKLDKAKLPHQVLNAKQHEKEAHIISQAGMPGMITIATNMAGRGTDIVLGGNIDRETQAVEQAENLSDAEKQSRLAELHQAWEKRHSQVVAAGGLRIVGTERHESRRIDNQLRGRSGRQGDPGSSRFYLSLEDPLLRIFAADKLNAIMVHLRFPEGEPIEHRMVNRSMSVAQRKVEQHNFDLRKHLLEYDDVANEQRRIIYSQRDEILQNEDVSTTIANMRNGVLADLVHTHIPPDSLPEQWDVSTLESVLASDFQLALPLQQWLKDEPNLNQEELLARIQQEATHFYNAKVERLTPFIWRQVERNLMLQVLDNRWREHLAAMDHLRQGINLRSYAQKNPKQEFKREAFELFEDLLNRVRNELTRLLMTAELRNQEPIAPLEEPREENLQYTHDEAQLAAEDDAAEKDAPPPRTPRASPITHHKVGRNEPCPCGSGKKFKHCHGRLS